MEESIPPADLPALPEFESLTSGERDQLLRMRDDMRAKGLPAALITSGLRSTANLLMEQQAAEAPIMEAAHVRRFIEENNGTAVSRGERAVPRKETRQRQREALLDRVSQLVMAARSATRRHELLRLRREMLGLDQGYLRRALGADGDRLCAEMNDWLMDAATRLHVR